MLEQLADGFRKLSIVIILVGLLVVFYTEAFSDVPIGRAGRPKPPLAVQRRNYLLLIAAGVPGACWAVVRTARGDQRTFWE
jgi:hypothetical protein